jgi:acetolactate synthase-1/2/3 large subunit
MAPTRANAPTVSAALPALLEAYGVDTVFGIPGNHTVELHRHLGDARIRHVTSRHEQGAGFMADGYARATGKPGVCLLISGPGLLNAATAIAQARADSVPMLVITAVAPVAHLGMNRGTLHELPDQRATAATLCRSSHTLLKAANLAEVIHGAFVTFASARPGPVHVEIPLDLMTAPCAGPQGARPVPAAPAPDPAAVTEAARRLRDARRPLIVVGGGAAAASDAVRALAERLDAPVLNTTNGKGVCPYGHPQAVGGSPSLPSLGQAMSDADCLLAIGTELAETDFDLLLAGPPSFPANLIRLDIDAQQLTRNAVASLPLLGDAAAGTRALLEALGSGTRGAAARAAELRREIAAEAHNHPETAAFFAALREALPNAVLVGDSTRPTYYAAWQYECPAPRRYFHSVSGFGTLGYAIPAAFGAALAQPRPVLALIGDGGAQFTWGELQTGAQLRLGVPVLVWRNDGYEEIANSMTAAAVDPASTRIDAPDFRLGAAAHGCAYHRPRDLATLKAVLGEAVAATAPTVIELHQQDFLTRPSGGWYR